MQQSLSSCILENRNDTVKLFMLYTYVHVYRGKNCQTSSYCRHIYVYTKYRYRQYSNEFNDDTSIAYSSIDRIVGPAIISNYCIRLFESYERSYLYTCVEQTILASLQACRYTIGRAFWRKSIYSELRESAIASLSKSKVRYNYPTSQPGNQAAKPT